MTTTNDARYAMTTYDFSIVLFSRDRVRRSLEGCDESASTKTVSSIGRRTPLL